MDKLYFIKDGRLTKKDFEDKIIFSLENVCPFGDIETIAIVMGARKSDVYDCLLDRIVEIVKTESNYSNICRKYKIRTKFIEDLIEDGRLELVDTDLQDLKNEFSADEKESIDRNRDIQRKIGIMGLSSVMSNSASLQRSSTRETTSSSNGFRFVQKK